MKEKIFKKGIARRLFSLVLALAMVLSLMPSMSLRVNAEEGTVIGEGYSLTVTIPTTDGLTASQIRDGIQMSLKKGEEDFSNLLSLEEGNLYILGGEEFEKMVTSLNSHKDRAIFMTLQLKGGYMFGGDIENPFIDGYVPDFEMNINTGFENAPIGGYISTGRLVQTGDKNGEKLYLYIILPGDGNSGDLDDEDILKLIDVDKLVCEDIESDFANLGEFFEISRGDLCYFLGSAATMFDLSFEENNSKYTWTVDTGEGKFVVVVNLDANHEVSSVVITDELDFIMEGTFTFVDPDYTPPTHTHGSWDYSVNGTTLTAVCTVSGCSDPAVSATLTLSATSQNYSGSAVEATMDKTAWEAAGLTAPSIVYEAKTGSSLTNDKAINVGSYTAKITVDGKTASVDFEITKQPSPTPTPEPTPAPTPVTPYKAPNTGVR